MKKVGIVGCGGIAQVHAQVLSQMENVSFCACADIRMERAEKMAAAYGLKAYASLTEMLDDEALDVLHICTPHYLHTPMLAEAAARGIAVFTEKPPVIDRAQWTSFEAAAGKIPVGICFQNRYNPNVQALKALISGGELGKLLGARAFVTWKREASYYTDSGWRGTWETEGGGVLINQSIHTLDLLIYLMGKPDMVEGSMANHHLKGVIQVEDTLEAWLGYPEKTAVMYATTAYSQDAPVLLDFHFENAVVRLEGAELEIRRDGETERQTFENPAALGKGYWGTGHGTCIQDFYDALEKNRPYQNDTSSVRDTVDVMLSLYEQCRGKF